jgi:hypothetical protein
MNWHVKFGFAIESGEDIEIAIKNTAGTHVANLEPNRMKGNKTWLLFRIW